MSRKKSRPASPAMGGETAVVSGPEANGKLSVSLQPAPQRFWLEAVVVRAARWLGSLQMAVVLLSLFALVLAVGTVVESWYSDKVAKDLVYRTWWFNLLLFLIGINIF